MRRAMKSAVVISPCTMMSASPERAISTARATAARACGASMSRQRRRSMRFCLASSRINFSGPTRTGRRKPDSAAVTALCSDSADDGCANTAVAGGQPVARRVDVARHDGEELDVLRPERPGEDGAVPDPDLIVGAVLDELRGHGDGMLSVVLAWAAPRRPATMDTDEVLKGLAREAVKQSE